MKTRMLGRHLREGCKNLLRNGWMTFASVSAVAITLLILGVTLVIALNAQQLSNYVAGQLQVNAYLKQNVSSKQAQQITAEVKALPGVSSVRYVSKQQGLKELQQRLGKEYQDVLQGFANKNPLPDEIVVQAADPKQTLKCCSKNSSAAWRRSSRRRTGGCGQAVPFPRHCPRHRHRVRGGTRGHGDVPDFEHHQNYHLFEAARD